SGDAGHPGAGRGLAVWPACGAWRHSTHRGGLGIMFRSFGLSEFWFLIQSLQWTLILTGLALVGGGFTGFFIALARVSTMKWLRVVALVYIQTIQGTPVLMILFLSYYG